MVLSAVFGSRLLRPKVLFRTKVVPFIFRLEIIMLGIVKDFSEGRVDIKPTVVLDGRVFIKD